MSKLGAAPPPPPYKVPLSERLFGIGKLRPPVTEGVSNSGDALPASIRLGDYTLAMDAKGVWHMSGALVQLYQNQITQLEAKVAQLEDERLSRNVLTLEQENIAMGRERLALLDENSQLKFKNKVLMAMCTISEGDYKALCKEAGIEPRSQKKPLPAPMPAASPSHGQQQQQPLASPGPSYPQASPSNLYSTQQLQAPSAINTGASPMAAQSRGSAVQQSYSQQQPPPSASNQQFLQQQQSARNLQPQPSPGTYQR